MASIKYKDNGEYKDIVVKVGDTLPIGTEIDYDGAEVPNGWEEVDNVLWTNPSPTSDFGDQNLVIGNYRKIDIIYRRHTSSENQIVMTIYNTGVLTEAFGIYNDKLILRQSSYSNDTLYINKGVIYNTYGSPTTNQNDVMIPIKIIGYK